VKIVIRRRKNLWHFLTNSEIIENRKQSHFSYAAAIAVEAPNQPIETSIAAEKLSGEGSQVLIEPDNITSKLSHQAKPANRTRDQPDLVNI
jgi:hypothetical protein